MVVIDPDFHHVHNRGNHVNGKKREVSLISQILLENASLNFLNFLLLLLFEILFTQLSLDLRIILTRKVFQKKFFVFEINEVNGDQQQDQADDLDQKRPRVQAFAQVNLVVTKHVVPKVKSSVNLQQRRQKHKPLFICDLLIRPL